MYQINLKPITRFSFEILFHFVTTGQSSDNMLRVSSGDLITVTHGCASTTAHVH